MDRIYLPESVGNRPELLGPRDSTSDENYSVVLSTDRIFETTRVFNGLQVDPIPPEVVENDIFGFPLVDDRIILFADTNAYGIDERKWVLDYSLTSENNIPPNLHLWSTAINYQVNETESFYKGVDTDASYGNTSIDLSIPQSDIELDRFVICSTKQTFDCAGASNLFISFGVKCDQVNNSTKKVGLFSQSSGWYLEIKDNGQGDNFSIVRRYKTTDEQVIEVKYPRSSNVFDDKLDGSGLTQLNLDFTLVAMYAIEVGSYDGTAVRFFVYAKDSSQGGTHRWIKFASIPTSDVDTYVERNPVSLPITFELSSNGSEFAYLNKYGTSVTKSGTEKSPLKIFSAPGIVKELSAEKEVFITGFLTKEVFNLQPCSIQQFPKYLNVNSNVPVELVIRRTLVDITNVRSFPFKPQLDEIFDSNEVLFLVSKNELLLCSLELQAVYLKVTIDGGFENVVYSDETGYLYATQKENPNLIVIEPLTGKVVNKITGGNRAIPSDIRIVGEYLFLTHPSDNNITVWDLNTLTVSNPLPVQTIQVGSSPQKFVEGDLKLFITNKDSNNITVVNLSNLSVSTISGVGLNKPSAITFNNGVLYIANTGDSFIRVYDTRQNQRLQQKEFSITGEPKLIQFIDTVDKLYVVNKTGGITVANYLDNLPNPEPVLSSFDYQKEIISVSVTPKLELIIYDGSLVLNYDTNVVIIDINEPINLLRDQLSQSGIAPILHQNFQKTGEKIFSIISAGAKQFSLVKIFQEYREFFASSFDNFNNNKTISQDLILFYLKNIGELLSQESNQINWLSGSGDSILDSYSTDQVLYPPFISNPGYGSVSLISSQY